MLLAVMMALAAVQAEPVAAPQEDAAPAAETAPQYGSAAHVTGFLSGEFSNEAQWSRANPSLHREPEAGGATEWLDHQHIVHTQVDAPQIGDHVLYLEWRSGGPEGAISRQRIWAVRTDADGLVTGFDFFTFRDPEPYAGRAAEPGAFMELSTDDLIGYPDTCLAERRDAAHAGYYFAVDPETCLITAQSGTQMRIFASIRALGNSLTYREQGTMEDGRVVFRVPGTPMPYSFIRQEEAEPASEAEADSQTQEQAD